MSALMLTGALLFAAPSTDVIVPFALPATPPAIPLAAPPLVAAPPLPDLAPGAASAAMLALPGQVAPAPTPADAQPRDIVVTGRGEWEAPDPFSDINEKGFEVSQFFDKNLLAPIALAYKDVIPKPVRDGAHNFLYNMREPVVFINFVLQLKIGRALETVGRFAINSTIGVLGIFDFAKRKPFRWKRRSNGFANTFGYYGIKSGPFMWLPVVGPTTPRDLIGGALDRILFPFIYGSRITKPEFAIPFAIVGMLDHRAEFDDTLHQLHDGQADPYARSRDFYLQRRQNEIDELKGKAARNSSGMSEAPTEPVKLRKRSDDPTLQEPAPAPAVIPPPPVTPPPVVRTVPDADLVPQP